MGSKIKGELSQKNDYYINKHRYYELKHFCLQYPIWKKAYNSLDGLSRRPTDLDYISKSGFYGNPTEKCIEAREHFLYRMKMIEESAMHTDNSIGAYILKAVTEGYAYEYLSLNMKIPCCRASYYSLYRKFFWILSQIRN